MRVGALAVAVVVLTTLGAGCIAQDKPHHGAFTIIAQAGHDVVEEAGHAAQFHWSAHDAIEAEGNETPHVELEFEWTASGAPQALSHGENATLNRTDEGLALVQVNVSAEGALATDVAAALFTETPSTGARLYVAAVGPVRLNVTGLHPEHEEVVAIGETAAQLVILAATVSATTVDISLVFDEFAALGGPTQGAIIVAMRAPGVEWTQMTGPSEFEAGEAHVLRIQTGATGGASLIVGAPGHQATTTIEQYGEEHPAEGEGRAVVSRSQSLPGFEAAAAAFAATTAGVLALLARRRPRA